MTPLLEQLLEHYPQQVKIVFKHFPLRNHRFALPAALASLAAHRQGKFWPYHDAIFANYKGLNETFLTQIAQDLELDMEQFQRDRRDRRLQAQVQADMQLARSVGVRGTPTVFVNGRLLKQKTPQGFKTLIDRLLKDSD